MSSTSGMYKDPEVGSVFSLQSSKTLPDQITEKEGAQRLLINGSSTSDLSAVLPHWANHFASLNKSKCSSNLNLQKFSDSIHKIECETYSEEDTILDTSFAPEEIRAAIRLLKKGSSACHLLSPCRSLNQYLAQHDYQ